MVEESDKSDSWGSLLINGILNKLSLVSDQDKHLMINPMRKDTSKEVTKKMVTKKVQVRPKSNKIEGKFTSNQLKRITKHPVEDNFKVRLVNGYSNKILMRNLC